MSNCYSIERCLQLIVLFIVIDLQGLARPHATVIPDHSNFSKYFFDHVNVTRSENVSNTLTAVDDVNTDAGASNSRTHMKFGHNKRSVDTNVSRDCLNRDIFLFVPIFDSIRIAGYREWCRQYDVSRRWRREFHCRRRRLWVWQWWHHIAGSFAGVRHFGPYILRKRCRISYAAHQRSDEHHQCQGHAAEWHRAAAIEVVTACWRHTRRRQFLHHSHTDHLSKTSVDHRQSLVDHCQSSAIFARRQRWAMHAPRSLWLRGHFAQWLCVAM